MMVYLVYALCALTAFACACLLLLAYYRSRYRLLLWGGLCFIGLTLNNIFVILDKFVLPMIDLSYPRLLSALLAVLILLYGLIYDPE